MSKKHRETRVKKIITNAITIARTSSLTEQGTITKLEQE